MQQTNDATAYVLVLCLPLVAWVLSKPPVWRRLRPHLEVLARRVVTQLVTQDEPDEVVLRRWAHLRLTLLRADLDRVERLLADDLWMTGTRQVGNRIAYARLVRDVRDAEVTAAAYGPVEEVVPVAVPTPTPRSRLSYTSAAASGPVVEVIELGPSGRWF